MLNQRRQRSRGTPLLTFKNPTTLDKMFMSLCMTTAVIELSEVGAEFIDGIFTSKALGANEMAAVGLCYAYFSFAGVLSGLLARGMQTRCTKSVGGDKLKDVNTIFNGTLTLAVALSLLLAVLMYLFREPIVVLLGARGNADNLFPYALDYLTGLILGFPAMILHTVIASGIQVDGGERLIRAASLIGGGLDVLLDWVAIKLDMGCFGIGLATSLARYLSLLVLMTNFLRKGRILSLRPSLLKWRDFVNICSLGSDRALKRMTNIFKSLALNSLVISVGGSAAMTVLSIRNSLANVADIPREAIARATGLMTCIYYGEVNAEDIRNTGRKAHSATLVYVGLTTLILILLARPIAVFYIGKSELLPLMMVAILALAFDEPLHTLTQARISYLQAIDKVRNANILTFLTAFGALVPTVFVFGLLFKSYGIMIAFTAADLFILMGIYIGTCCRHRTLRPLTKDYLALPAALALSPGDVIEYSIHTKEEIALASEQTVLFAKGHKLDAKKGLYMGIALEEIITFIFDHHFKDRKQASVDIRLTVTEGELVLRIRDYSQPFSVLKFMKATEESTDLDSGFGVRMVARLTDNVSCYRTFGTNNTIIRL